MNVSNDVLAEILGYVSKYPKLSSVSHQFKDAYNQHKGQFGTKIDLFIEKNPSWNKTLRHAMFYINMNALLGNWSIVKFIYDNMINPDKELIDEDDIIKKHGIDIYQALLTMYLLLVYNAFNKFSLGYKYYNDYKSKLSLLPDFLGENIHIMNRYNIFSMTPYIVKALLNRYEGIPVYLSYKYDMSTGNHIPTDDTGRSKEGIPVVSSFETRYDIGYSKLVEFIKDDQVFGKINIPKDTHKSYIHHILDQTNLDQLIGQINMLPNVSISYNNPSVNKLMRIVELIYSEPVYTPRIINASSKILDIYFKIIPYLRVYTIQTPRSNPLLQYTYRNKYKTIDSDDNSILLAHEVYSSISPNAKK